MVGALAFGFGLSLLAFTPVASQQPPAPVAALLLASAILLICGLPGLYAAQSTAIGVPGLVGHVLLTVGLFVPVLYAAPPILYPSLSQAPPDSALLFGLAVAMTAGLLVTGVTALRGGVVPRPAAVLLLAATVGFFFDLFIAEFMPAGVAAAGTGGLGLLVALGFGWMGAAMLMPRPSVRH